jgi:hypothetical protein
MSRRPALSNYSQRLTPAEVARNWFRRGPDYMAKVPADFPKPGPDGLFLLSQVEAWFDRFHGIKQRPEQNGEEDAIMRAARGH